jgi:hypothetical protein
MRTVEFKFDIGEEVCISAIGMKGRVESLIYDSLGPQYRVVYWNDGARRTDWMYEWELGLWKGDGLTRG